MRCPRKHEESNETLGGNPLGLHVSALNISLHSNSARASHNLLTDFEHCSDSSHLLLYLDSFLQDLSLHHHSLSELSLELMWGSVRCVSEALASFLAFKNRPLFLCLSLSGLMSNSFVRYTSNTQGLISPILTGKHCGSHKTGPFHAPQNYFLWQLRKSFNTHTTWKGSSTLCFMIYIHCISFSYWAA